MFHDLDALLDAALSGWFRHRPAAVAHARIRLSRLELIGGSGRTRPGLERFWFCSAPAFPMAPSFRRPLSSRRGEALWEREAAGSGSPWGSPGVVSSESAAGFCGLRGLGRLLGSGLVAPVWVSGGSGARL